jgi:alpha-ribazole phosphatase
MQVYLVRHPRPLTVEGLCYGDLDVPVEAELFTAAVEMVSAQITSETLAQAIIYSSPSSRCLELARRLASPREPVSCEQLMEMNFGNWQGQAWDKLPREQLDAWAKDVWGYRPGGGESAEMVAARWQRWLAQARRIEAGSIVAVTHAGVIRVALACSGYLKATAPLEAHISFGSVHHLDIA